MIFWVTTGVAFFAIEIAHIFRNVNFRKENPKFLHNTSVRGVAF